MPYCDVANRVTITRTKCLVVLSGPLLWEYGTKFPLCCTAVLAALKVSHRAAQHPQFLWMSPSDVRRGPRCSKIWLSYQSHLIASWECSCRVWDHFAQLQGGLGASRCTSNHWSGHPECLGGLRVASGPIYILVMHYRHYLRLSGCVLVIDFP